MTSTKSPRPRRRPGGTRARIPRARILVPVDGSGPSRRATGEAAGLAARLGARLVGLHVITPFGSLPRKSLPAVVTAGAFKRHANRVAGGWLAAVKQAAAGAEVRCECHVAASPSPAAGILAAAANPRQTR